MIKKTQKRIEKLTKELKGLTESEFYSLEFLLKYFGNLHRQTRGCDFVTQNGESIEVKKNLLTENQTKEFLSNPKSYLCLVEYRENQKVMFLFKLKEVKEYSDDDITISDEFVDRAEKIFQVTKEIVQRKKIDDVWKKLQ
tara:strand:- start:708 stop:1127 length:420 start_codon:yes stop_codon:yes gene_type:complete